MLVVALVVCDYIDALPDFPSKFRFHAVLVLTVTVGYLCIAIACMEKYNILKRKNRVLEEALTEKEQEKVSILMERQSKQQQALQKGELEWFAGKIKMSLWKRGSGMISLSGNSRINVSHFSIGESFMGTETVKEARSTDVVASFSLLANSFFSADGYPGKVTTVMSVAYRIFNHHPAKCILCAGAGNALSMSLKSSSVREILRLRVLSSTWAMLLALGMAMTF